MGKHGMCRAEEFRAIASIGVDAVDEAQSEVKARRNEARTGSVCISEDVSGR